MVLDEGSIVELDKPEVLLQKPDGVFAELCRRSADWPVLQTMTRKNGD